MLRHWTGIALREGEIDLLPRLVPEAEVAIVHREGDIPLSRTSHPHDEGPHHGIPDAVPHAPRPDDVTTVRHVGNGPDHLRGVIVLHAGIDQGQIAQIQRIVEDSEGMQLGWGELGELQSGYINFYSGFERHGLLSSEEPRSISIVSCMSIANDIFLSKKLCSVSTERGTRRP
jgi:hypothetical protein